MIYEYCSHTHAARRRSCTGWRWRQHKECLYAARFTWQVQKKVERGQGGCGVGFVSDISWQFMVGQVDVVVVLLFAICAYNGSSRSSSSSRS